MRWVAPAIVLVAAIIMTLAITTTQHPSIVIAPVSNAVAVKPLDPAARVHGLTRLSVAPTFSLDVVITPTAKTVVVNQPHARVTVPPGEDVDLAGWAVDGAAMKPARAVLVEFDGSYLPALYGDERADVASVLGDEGLKLVGYKVRLPGAKLTPGTHHVGIIIVNSAGTGYYDAPERLLLVAKR